MKNTFEILNSYGVLSESDKKYHYIGTKIN